MSHVIEKWVINQEGRFGPCKEYLLPIPHHHYLDEPWYFVLSSKVAVPQSRVFDTPQEAALATVAFNDAKLTHIKMENTRLLEWYEELEVIRQRLADEEAKAEEHAT